ncbi:MAG: YncE family protein, partial [Thermoplasmata archaeon]
MPSFSGHYLRTTQLPQAGGVPAWLAFDPANGAFYVAESPSSVNVIAGGTTTVVATVNVGNAPFGVAYDSGTGTIYVANSGSNNVSVVSSTTQAVDASVSVGSVPEGVAYASAPGEVYVADRGSNTVSVIRDSTNTLVSIIDTGIAPVGIAYDPADGDLYVANSGSNSVSVIATASHSVVVTIPVGSGPYGVAYDGVDGTIYVSNGGSGSVSVIADSTDTVVATVHVGASPQGLAFDGLSDEIYVANGDSTVTAILGSTNSVITTYQLDPRGAAYDSMNGDVCVTNVGNNTFECLVPPGTTTYSVLATETGLPAGTEWAARLGATTETAAASWIIFFDASGTYAYTIAAPSGFTANPSSGVVVVSGRPPTPVAITFVAGETYPVVFTESGLPSGTSWSVTLNGAVLSSTTNTIGGAEANGTYGFSIPNAVGDSPSPSSGSVTVIGGPISVSVLFTALTYPVVFQETGLPSGTSWSVTMAATTETTAGPNITFQEPNGNYLYAIVGGLGYTAAPSYGYASVNGAPSVPVAIVFSPPGSTGCGVGALPTIDRAMAADRQPFPSSTTDFAPGPRLATTDLPQPGTHVSGTPAWLAYDSARAEFYVAECPSTVVVIVMGGPLASTVIGSIGVGAAPFGVAYDGATGTIYVANSGSGNVSVISDSTNKVVATIAIGGTPTGIAYDPANGEIYVANGASNDVAVISAATNDLVGTVPVGIAPVGVVNGSVNGDIYVANSGSNTVSVISQFTNAVAATVAVGTSPYGEADDGWNGEIYVTNSASNTVSVISEASNTVIATVPVGSVPQGIAYNGATGNVYVAESDYTVSVIWPRSHTVIETFLTDPDGAAFDTANGDVCFTNVQNNTFECALPSSVPTYLVTFTERGLPSGSLWSLTFGYGDTISTSSPSVVFHMYAGTWGFSIGAIAGYAATPPSGSVRVPGGSSSGSVSVTIQFAPPPPAWYDLNFTESGLGIGTAWSVNVNGATEESADATVSFVEINGTYTYSIGGEVGYEVVPATGTITVAGSAIVQGVVFSLLAPGTYSVSVNETGLPSGLVWTVTLGRASQTSLNPTISFAEANGTYAYTIASSGGYQPSTSAGTITVSGRAVTLSVAFSPPPSTYLIEFTQIGLPTGASWTVTLNGVSNTSDTSWNLFWEPNGTYSYQIGNVSGFTMTTSSSGTVVCAGGAHVDVRFVGTTYDVTFTETGLPTGTAWGVTLNGVVEGSTSTAIVFVSADGTFSYALSVVPGEVATPASGNVSVDGASVAVTVTFSTNGFAVTFTELGLSAGTSWSVTVNSVSQRSTTNEIGFTEAPGT